MTFLGSFLGDGVCQNSTWSIPRLQCTECSPKLRLKTKEGVILCIVLIHTLKSTRLLVEALIYQRQPKKLHDEHRPKGNSHET